MCATNLAQQIVHALGGRWNGTSGMARCPVHRDRVPSLAISDRGGKVLVHCHAGCNQKSVVSALFSLGLWPTRDRFQSASRVATWHQPESTVDAERAKQANRIWQLGGPAEDTIVERYVRRRAITTPLPACLRFSELLLHAPTGLYLPAALAAIKNSLDVVRGVQRVFLRPDGLGAASVAPNKMSLGTFEDGAVRLASAGETTGLCEGWETGLSAMQLTGLPVWCCLGASRMHRVVFPSLVRKIVIFADNDTAGREAAERTATVHRRHGRWVDIRSPGVGTDFNDELIQQANNG
jgi:putative DNA primase/helicase